MNGKSAANPLSPSDASHSGLEFAQRLFSLPATPSTAELLGDLAEAFGADGAGLGMLAGGPPLLRRSSLVPPPRWPWEIDPQLASVLRADRSARSLPHPEGGSFLAAAALGIGQTPWLLWLESRRRLSWNSAEAAAFILAAAAVARAADAGLPQGNQQMERVAQLQQLEQAALTVRRVAHDYGNVLTTILGFTELALAQPQAADGALKRHLTEIHQAAQSGAQLTSQLRHFARRQGTTSRPCHIHPVLAEEQARLQAQGSAKIDLELPFELPPVALDGDQLRTIVRTLLDNAAEALDQPGTVTVTARPTTIAAGECFDYVGDVRPGPHVEIRIADTGPGLSSDVRRRLFVEPFFSTKPRRRGYGLLAAYGVLRSCKGGLCLANATPHGTVARVVLPIAVLPAPAVVPSALERRLGEKIVPIVRVVGREEKIVSSSR